MKETIIAVGIIVVALAAMFGNQVAVMLQAVGH